MPKQVNWPLVGFFVVTFSFPVAAFFYEYVLACSDKNLLADIGKEKPVFGCVEFWLNRYQTLLSAIIAAGAAAVTILALIRQNRIARKQNIPAIIAVMRSHIAAIEVDLAIAKTIEEIAKEMPTVVEAVMAPQNHPEDLRRIIAEMQDRLVQANRSLGNHSRHVMDGARSGEWHPLHQAVGGLIQQQNMIMIGSFRDARQAIENSQNVPRHVQDDFNKLRAASTDVQVAVGGIAFPLDFKRREIERLIQQQERSLIEDPS
jgi:hypothetical protein